VGFIIRVYYVDNDLSVARDLLGIEKYVYVMKDRTNDSRNINLYNSSREYGSKSRKVASFDRMESRRRNVGKY
jgi:hypothetical protein